MDKSKVFLLVSFSLGLSHLLGYLVPAVTFIYDSCYLSFKIAIYLFAAMIGLWFGFLSLEKREFTIKKVDLKPLESIVKATEEKMSDLKFSSGKIKDTPLVSRNVDDVIDELISLLLKDYVHSWFDPLVKHPSLFTKGLKDPIRQMLFAFRDRCRKMHDVKLITNDVVIIITEHLQHIKAAVINPSEKIQPYKIYPFLSTKEKELDYLRMICEFLLMTLLPPEYVNNKPLRCLLREVFAVTVFYPVIDKLCDPDWINMKLILYIKQQQVEAEKHSRTYAYAETYEDFIKIIQESCKIEDLQRLRYYIVTEIMQATTMSNLKRSKGMDVDKEFNPQKTNKGDLLQARNLPRYLNQLRFAKTQCEKRLKALGGPDYVTSPRTMSDSLKDNYIPGQKVLSMSVIMQSSLCRRYFSKFLQKEERHSLLGFWEAVEEMKQSNKDLWHKLGNDILQMYIHNQSSCVRLNKNTLKGIEEFMMANKGPDAFFQAQEEIYKVLEENYYASFIVSDVYHKMLADVGKQGIDFMQELPNETEEEPEMIPEEVAPKEKLTDTSEVSVFDHSSYARSQLKILKEKLSAKRQALKALKNNPKCDKKVIPMMEKEIMDLVHEQNILENHIEKTELWIEYLGIWQATIIEALEKKENDKIVPYFVIRVHLANDAEIVSSQMVGWIVTKSLSSFHSLHQKLVPAAYWLKKIDLPTKPRFKSFDKNYLEKAKNSLQTFLSAVTKDDGLNKSEALYDFLIPSPEYMKHPPSTAKKTQKFNLLQFLKGYVLAHYVQGRLDIQWFIGDTQLVLFHCSHCVWLISLEDCATKPQSMNLETTSNVQKLLKNLKTTCWFQNTLVPFDDSDDDELLFLDDSESKEDKKDSIAEPLYSLIGEIFELKGVFNWLRRTLIIFVQITYGKTINRQLRETVSWIASEPMLLYYLQLFRDTMWPIGPATPTMEPETKEEKADNKVIARQMLLNNIPDILNKLTGQQHAKKGISKLFDALQNRQFNKQLLYKILEAFLYEYAPELRAEEKN